MVTTVIAHAGSQNDRRYADGIRYYNMTNVQTVKLGNVVNI